MLKQITDKERALIILEFTKSLLVHSGYGEVEKLKKILTEESSEKEKKPVPVIVKEIIAEQEKPIKKIGPGEIALEIGKEIETKPIIRPVAVRPRVLRIPEQRLPSQFQYLKPTFYNVEVDLGKLNPFLEDPIVRKIECNGPGEHIVVMVPMPKYTNIVLSKEEIDEIIKTFEEKSKIPKEEGIYNVVVGKLVFSAIISDVIGSKFSIKKMNYAPVFT